VVVMVVRQQQGVKFVRAKPFAKHLLLEVGACINKDFLGSIHEQPEPRPRFAAQTSPAFAAGFGGAPRATTAEHGYLYLFH